MVRNRKRWICHRPTRSHSRLEFDLMQEGLLKPILPEGLAPPEALKRDSGGRIWQRGGVELNQVFTVLLHNRENAETCFARRNRSFFLLRQEHKALFDILIGQCELIFEVVVKRLLVGMTQLYRSILLGLLDDIALAHISKETRTFETGEALVSTLMKSACAAAALNEGGRLRTTYEFDSADLSTYELAPIDVGVPPLSEIEERVGNTLSGWPKGNMRRHFEANPWPAILLAQLYEFGQENFFVGARFRALAGAIARKIGARGDLTDMSLRALEVTAKGNRK